jgi:hypothetical protein
VEGSWRGVGWIDLAQDRDQWRALGVVWAGLIWLRIGTSRGLWVCGLD